MRSTATAVKSTGRSSIRGEPASSRKAAIRRWPPNNAGRPKPGSSRRSIPRRSRRSSHSLNSASLPAACRPPTSAPLEDPAMATMLSLRASSAAITPICASPRAPPAPSTSATFSPLSIFGASAPAITRSSLRACTSSACSSLVVVAHRQLQQCTHLLAQRRRLDDLGIAAVIQHVHQQLAGAAVRHLQLVAAVREEPPLLLRMPAFVGDPARGLGAEQDRRPPFRRAGEDAVARGQVFVEFGFGDVARRRIEQLCRTDAIHGEAAQRLA